MDTGPPPSGGLIPQYNGGGGWVTGFGGGTGGAAITGVNVPVCGILVSNATQTESNMPPTLLGVPE